MGLHAIKTELEDLSLKYENPVEYQELENEFMITGMNIPVCISNLLLRFGNV